MAELHSHKSNKHLSLEKIIDARRQEIIAAGDKPHVTVEVQLKWLEKLGKSEVGQYMLQHGGINGYWTHRLAVAYPKGQYRPTTPFDQYFFGEAPAARATQERFRHFQRLVQAEVRDGSTLASIPCGVMADTLTLDYCGCNGVQLTGIDLDPESLEHARTLARSVGLDKSVSLEKRDAWSLGDGSRFDAIASNGLNFYIADEKRENTLYQEFRKVLRPGGLLVTSFWTPPPTPDSVSEWNMAKINADHLLSQRIIFTDVLKPTWRNYTTSDQMRHKLAAAGFETIEIHYDEARMMPTVTARKP